MPALMTLRDQFLNFFYDYAGATTLWMICSARLIFEHVALWLVMLIRSYYGCRPTILESMNPAAIAALYYSVTSITNKLLVLHDGGRK